MNLHLFQNLNKKLSLVFVGLGSLLMVPLQGAEENIEKIDFHLEAPHLLEVSLRSVGLRVADLNSDGLPDIVTAANDKSILELYLQKSGDELAFERQEVALDQFVQGLAIMDVDGDGRTDVITAGAPARLSWLRQGKDGVLSSPQRLDKEVVFLRAADLKGKGALDLVCVNERTIEVIPSGKQGLNWEESQVYWSAFALPGAPWICDLNGDGLMDLVFTESHRNDRLIARFQTPEGFFPDEAVLETNGLGALDVGKKEGQPQTLVGVLSKTGSIDQMAWTYKEKLKGAPAPSAQALGRTRVVAFDPESRSDRLVSAWVPLEGGGAPCILVAGPGSPSIRLARTASDGSLRVRSIPSLTGIMQLLPVPPRKKGDRWAVGLVSRAEKTLAFGWVDPKGETVSFPQPMPIGGAPLVATVANLGRGDALDLAVCRSDESDNLQIEAHFDIDPDNPTASESITFDFEGTANDQPGGLLAMDLNHDQRTDLVVLFDYADPVLLMQTEPKDGKEQWEALQLAEGMLQGLLQGARTGNVQAVSLSENDKTSLLITKENYARAVHLDAENRVVVDAQFNTKNARGRLRGAITAKIDGPKKPSAVVLLDISNQSLTLYKRPSAEGDFELGRHVEIDDADYQSMIAADLNDDARDDLILLAPDRMTVLYVGVEDGRLETIAKAKTDVEDGNYGLVRSVRLLESGGEQILAVENTEDVLEFFLNEAEDGLLRRFYRFKVFDRDTRRNRLELSYSQTQPRDIKAADLNNDGKPDLVLLMHDRIGVYLQKD